MQSDDSALSQQSQSQDEPSSQDLSTASSQSVSGEDVVSPSESQPTGRRADAEGKRRSDRVVARASQREVEEPVKVSYRSRELSLADQVLLFIADVGGLWKRALRWVRSQLPRNWQTQLSDEILSAILLGTLFLFLVIWNPLGGSKRPAVEVAESPPAVALQKAEEASPESTVPEVAQSVPEPSPEDARILEVQEQVTEITQAYAAGLIQSVRANFLQGTLFVNLGAGWYDLTRSQQDQLAQDIYQRSQELTFKQLYLLDVDATPVARNPVVGSHMIVLQRTPANDAGLKIPS